ncbi:eukaryotic translation initiation factor 2D-like [Actinia tenebrosa]|uniref:Eukaryotic translation initiation factor 2D-like n=1 Tax=Actinia tenebrosa TaxID=6105 RepID=A0A6P8HKL9_ACTTE|nr:eukaryotic translation initiation factor 2D-like [Actinia tenebrosa]
MFIKAFKIKTSTAIRGSDRRKLRAQVQASFPKLDAEELSVLIPNKEEMTITKISTHSGDTVTFYSVSGEPVFFEVEKRIFPTVYTLWKYPDMLLSFTTWPLVLENLSGGADLMLPGIILPPGGLDSIERFEKNTICCVKLKGNNAPVAVGLTTVSRKDLYEDGMRGKGVNILHVFTDCLWAHGSKTLLPQINEQVDSNKEMLENDEEIQDGGKEMKGETEETPKFDAEAKAEVATTEQSHADNEEKLGKDESTTDTSHNGLLIEDIQSISIQDPALPSDEACASNCNVLDHSTNKHENSQAIEDNLATIPTTSEEMDELLGYCFFCAVLRLKENDLPLLTSAFFRNHMLPYSPDGKFLDLKKSSYKKLSKFLQSMQERGVIKIQEMSKGVDSVIAVDFSHEELKSFKTSIDSLPPKPIKTAPVSTNKQQGPVIEEMVSVSGGLANLFATAGYEKGSVFTLAEARKFVTEYAKTNELVDKNNPRMVILDPVLTKALVNKNEDVPSLNWENLFTRVLNKMNSCYQITLPGQSALLRKGKIDPLEIKIEQRMGNKKVTLVRNLDAYGIEPQEFAHKIQLKAACSTSVNQLPGKHKTPGMQVMVQGNQVSLVATALLDDYKIPKKYISGLELLKNQKKKKK